MPPSTPPAQLFIQNVLALRDYETGLVRRVDRILQVLFRNITGRLQTDYADLTPFELNRIQALYARTDQMIRSAYERIDKIGEKEMLELAGVQSIFAEETIRLEGRAVGVEINTTRLTSSQLKVIAEAPIEGAKIKEWWDKQSLNTRFATRQQVQLGLLQGETTATISRRLVTATARGDTGVVAVSRQHASTLTRTAITSIAARSQLEAYRKAGITHYRYVATLDDRTTAICQSLDGKIFKVPGERRPVRVPSEAKSELLVKDISKLSSEQMETLTKKVSKSIAHDVDKEAGFSPFEREESMGQYGNEFTPNTIASFRKGREPEEIIRWLAIDALARGQEAAVWMRRVPEGTEGAGLGWVIDAAAISGFGAEGEAPTAALGYRRFAELLQDGADASGPSALDRTAVERFGTTESFDAAGFILRDGTLIDFSGGVEGSEFFFAHGTGARNVDHLAVSELFDEAEERARAKATGVDPFDLARRDFLKKEVALRTFLDRTGAIRLSYALKGTFGKQLSVGMMYQPTPAQRRVVLAIAKSSEELRPAEFHGNLRFAADISDALTGNILGSASGELFRPSDLNKMWKRAQTLYQTTAQTLAGTPSAFAPKFVQVPQVDFSPLDGSTLVDGKIIFRNFTESLTDAQYQKLLEQALDALDVPSSALATGHFLGDYLDGENLVRAAGGSAGEALRILSAETAPHLREINRILGNADAEFDKRLADYITNHTPKGFGDLEAPSSNLPSDPDYVYHATNNNRAQSITEDGLETHGPNFGTPNQNVWPDGLAEPRVYFTPNASIAGQFAPAHGEPVILRVKRSDLQLWEDGTGDLYSLKGVPPKFIEVLTDSGWGWEPLLAIAPGVKPKKPGDPKEEESPLPPQHINCRSKIVPVMDFEALGLKDPGKIVGRTRASQTGPTKARDYEEWLKGQTEEIQNKALGTGKAEIWRDGKVTLAELVKADGTAITLAELRERLGIPLTTSGLVDRSGPVDAGGGLMSASRPKVIAWMQNEMKAGDPARVIDKLLDRHEWVKDNTIALRLAEERGEPFHHHRVAEGTHDDYTTKLSHIRADVVRRYLEENPLEIFARMDDPDYTSLTLNTAKAYRRLMANWGGSATSDAGSLLKVLADDWYGAEGVQTVYGQRWIDEDNDLRQEFLLKQAERLWMDEDNYTEHWGVIGISETTVRNLIREAMAPFILEGYTDVEAWEAVSTMMRLQHETGIAFMKNLGVETFTSFRGSDGDYWAMLGEQVPEVGESGTMAYNSVASFSARESMGHSFGTMTVQTTVPIEDYFGGWLTDDVLSNEAEILQIGRPRPYTVVRLDDKISFDPLVAAKELTVTVKDHLAIANAPEDFDHQGIIQDLSDGTELSVKDKVRVLTYPLPKDFWVSDDEDDAPGLNFVVSLWATDPLALNAFSLWTTKIEGWASPNTSIAWGGHKHYLDYVRFIEWLFTNANKVKFGQNTEMAQAALRKLRSIGLSQQQATDLAVRLIAEQKRAFYALAVSDEAQSTFWWDDWQKLDKIYGQHFATYPTNQPEDIL